MDLTKPRKMEIEYRRDGVVHYCLLDYENIADICYGCSQDHKFASCVLNSKKIAFRIERFPQVADNIVLVKL